MQHGIDAVTLSAVGDEANMARATVYSYFRGRSELLQSVVADDLNLLAQAMRRVAGMPEPPNAPPPPSRIVRFEIKAQGQNIQEDDGWIDGDDELVEQPMSPKVTASPKVGSTGTTSDVVSHAYERPSDHFSGFEPEQFEVAVPDIVHAPRDVAVREARTAAHEAPTRPAEHDAEPEEPFEPTTQEEVTPAVASVETHEESPSESQEPDSALEPRLPDREERIRVIGKRLLATQELRDTVKKLAPVYTPESEDIVAKLEEAATKRESGYQERMERRFGQLERNLSALEERASKSGEDVTGAIASLRNGLADLESRTKAGDKVQQDTMLKMMAEIRDAIRRLDRIEGANDRFPEDHMHDAEKSAEQPATGVKADDIVEPAKVAVSAEDIGERADIAESEPEEPVSEPIAAPAARTERQDDYLAAARRAMATVANEIEHSNKARSDAKNRQTKWAVIGVAVVGLALVGAALGMREVAGGTTPGAVAAHKALPEHLKVAALTPLDRVTADARAGKPEAEVEVGVKYLSGDGIPKNEAEAAKWIERAAATGYAPGEGWLGTLYDRGKGVAHDPQQAISWFQKAAKQGNRKSMHDLGLAYAQGDGVALNYFEAAHWFSRAAALGYVDSAFNLAVLYERGDGVPQSLIDAYKWYAIAAAEGDKEAATRMEAIGPELSPDALAAAKAAAASFRPGATVTGANLVAHDMIIGSP
jgi:TPR repeat protein